MTKIKICGITCTQDVKYINEALPDYAGFLFVPESRRFLTPEVAADLRREMDERVCTVGVFRNAAPQQIESLVQNGTIGAVQLHGTEDEAYVQAMKYLSVPVIKAVRVEDENSFGAFPADFLLFDNGAGGTGESFGLELLEQARAAKKLTAQPFFIAGGITVENIGDALRQNAYGIDVSSGAETDEKKDGAKIHALVQRIRQSKAANMEKDKG